MSNRVEKAVEQLADALFDEVLAVLNANAFNPSDKFKEDLYHLIRSSIGMS